MKHNHPPDLILAIVTIETWPPVEKPYPYPRKQSTPPKVEPWCSYPIYLVNRGDVALDIEYSTGGFASDDDRLVETSVSADAAHVEPREAALVETTDEGAFDFTFYYEVRVRAAGSGEIWRGILGVSRWGGGPFDRLEEDPVLGQKVRAIQAKDWKLVTA